MKFSRSLLCLLWLFSGGVAFADVPPPPGSKETCTRKKQETDGKTCEECSSSFRTKDKCQKAWGSKGYTKACQTAGASVWDEIWCKQKSGGGENKGSPPDARPGTTPDSSGGGGTSKSTGCQLGSKNKQGPLSFLALIFLVFVGVTHKLFGKK